MPNFLFCCDNSASKISQFSSTAISGRSSWNSNVKIKEFFFCKLQLSYFSRNFETKLLVNNNIKHNMKYTILLPFILWIKFGGIHNTNAIPPDFEITQNVCYPTKPYLAFACDVYHYVYTKRAFIWIWLRHLWSINHGQLSAVVLPQAQAPCGRPTQEISF